MTPNNDYIEFPDEDGVTLSGLSHPCPLCFTVLNVRGYTTFSGKEKYYYCSSCGSNFDACDLLECYRTKEL